MRVLAAIYHHGNQEQLLQATRNLFRTAWVDFCSSLLRLHLSSFLQIDGQDIQSSDVIQRTLEELPGISRKDAAFFVTQSECAFQFGLRLMR